MKWRLTKNKDQVDVHPEIDILPHQMHVGCPCKVTIIHMKGGDVIDLDLQDSGIPTNKIVAITDLRVVLHHHNLANLLIAKN